MAKASNTSGEVESKTPPVLQTQVLDDIQTPSVSSSTPQDSPSPSQTEIPAGTPQAEALKFTEEPQVLEKSDIVPEKAEDVNPDPTAIPGGGLNVALKINQAQDPAEKAKKRKQDIESSPAKDLIQVIVSNHVLVLRLTQIRFSFWANLWESLK